jgi:hypothetical protein
MPSANMVHPATTSEVVAQHGNADREGDVQLHLVRQRPQRAIERIRQGIAGEHGMGDARLDAGEERDVLADERQQGRIEIRLEIGRRQRSQQHRKGDASDEGGVDAECPAEEERRHRAVADGALRIEIAADDEKDCDAQAAKRGAQRIDRRLGQSQQSILMRPEHKAGAEKPQQVKGVRVLAHSSPPAGTILPRCGGG